MEAVPRSFFSWNFEILENSQKIADLDMSSWREKGLVQVDGANFTISKEGFINPTFTFSQDNTELATATKETMLSHGFVVDVDGKRFYLKKKSFFSRVMLFSNDLGSIGTIKRRSLFKRGALVELPEDVDLPVRIFVIWLVLLMWKRDSDNAASSGSG
jgi:hypothetical protein